MAGLLTDTFVPKVFFDPAAAPRRIAGPRVPGVQVRSEWAPLARALTALSYARQRVRGPCILPDGPPREGETRGVYPRGWRGIRSKSDAVRAPVAKGHCPNGGVVTVYEYWFPILRGECWPRMPGSVVQRSAGAYGHWVAAPLESSPSFLLSSPMQSTRRQQGPEAKSRVHLWAGRPANYYPAAPPAYGAPDDAVGMPTTGN
jgi:hypothetical protein